MLKPLRPVFFENEKIEKIKFKRVFPFSTSKYLVIKLNNIRKIKVLISKNDKFFLDQKENNIYDKLLEIPCDYDGYDMVFEQEKTDPNIYNSINEIITNGQYKIKTTKLKKLSTNSHLEEFYDFYNEWLKNLRNEGFVYYYNNERSIEEFVEAIIKMLKVNKYEVNLNKDIIIENYRNKLKELGTEDMMNYYVLTANIVADELRKYNIELIDLFDGFSNYDFAIIHNNNIQKLKELEKRIKC